MRGKLILVSLGLLAAVLIWTLALAGETRETFTADPVEGMQSVQAPLLRAPCAMAKTNGIVGSYFGGFDVGMVNVTYFNPVTECGAPAYPFEITDFSFTLYDFMLVGSVPVDIVVYDMVTYFDSCAGPGAELCRYSMTADANYMDPNIGTFYFPAVCCVDGPFYIGIEYTGGDPGAIPSILYDDLVADTCDNWFYYAGTWYEWFDIWNPPAPGYPLFWVGGETVSPNCEEPECNWQPGDPHKMHYPQLPDTVGWDVNATAPVVLADDWQCSETGYVKDFHFWGSWKDDAIGEILYFVLSIHDNIPEGGQFGQCFADGDVDNNGIALTVADLVALIQYLFQGGNPPIPWYSADLNGDCVIDSRDAVVYQNYFIYGLAAFDPYGGYPVPTCCDSILHSRPDSTLWEATIYDFDIVPFDPPTMEGWYDPSTGEVIEDDHQSYFQYNICLPEADWFWQYQDSIYWLNISAVIADTINTHWGWKSSYHHFMDDAVWAYWGDLEWQEMFEPSDPLMNMFWVRVDEQGWLDSTMSGGTDPYGQGWYYYPYTEWWNIWFYDHPFTYDREKVIHVAFDVMPDDPSQPWEFTFAINWSTDIWSLEGQPPGDSMPPLPGFEPESLYIGRDTYLTGEPTAMHYEFDWRIRDYNPEWVSIDIQGYNFIIPEGMGTIWHDCRQSLDLSFVVTGGEPPPPTGACCYDHPTGMLCVETTLDSCLNVFFGDYQGDGTVCQGMEACCIPGSGCIDADALCCVNVLGGVPQGPGTQCTGPQACCLPNGNCVMTDPLCCVSIFNGVPQGAGTVCTGNQACCINNVCSMMDSLCCIDLGGIPQGSGTTCTQPVACCLATGECIEVDPLCCDELGGTPGPAGSTCGPVEACCFQGGACDTLDPYCCELLGGEAQGPGTVCLGDFDPQNGIDDACEEECDCDPGNVDGNDILNISDAVYLITYIFGGGPPATPYPLCSCDMNCDCVCNVSDVVYMIAFIFAGGPPACSCQDWLDACGPPLR